MKQTATCFTFEDMRKFATEAWGPLGANTVDRWAEFNATYFQNRLRPIPLVITNTQPFGSRLAFCSWGGRGRTITVNVPRSHDRLVADNATLLHEMVHQCCAECGEDAAHSSPAWRREIMRLHKTMTGNEIWAGRSATVRRKINGASKSKVIRINVPHPDTGAPSLTQDHIARWPRSCGICLGKLGSEPKLKITQRMVGV